MELGDLRGNGRSKKKKRKNKIKESRTMLGQAKYDLVNKLNPGSTNKMMGELRSQSLLGAEEKNETFEFEAQGNYKPLNIPIDEESP
jgi:hypothetical protein